jgi:hypothetical protein
MAERWPYMKDHRQKTALQEMEADIENARGLALLDQSGSGGPVQEIFTRQQPAEVFQPEWVFALKVNLLRVFSMDKWKGQPGGWPSAY